jgi:uncharacterized protein (DUF1697 family)
MTTLISLLRGINVGGNKKIRMAQLQALYESLGFTSVRTLLQSGNVIFDSASADTDQVTASIETSIQHQFGFEVQIIIRTAAEWQSIVTHHPFSAEQLTEPGKILVTFLQQAPEDAPLAALRTAHTGPEIIHSHARELYIFYPDGMGRSKLDNGLIERRLGCAATGRNWNTVNKILALCSG